MLARSEEATLSLDVLVVGGGIGGLAAAYALAQAGHTVRVLEKSGYEPIPGGLRITPNFCKILVRWAGADKVAEMTLRCWRTTFGDGITGDIVGHLPWIEEVIRDAGADYVLLMVNECRQLLFDLAVSAGVRIDKNTAVTKVKPSDNAQDPRPSVTTSKGEVIQADLVVCSEGARGPLRSQVFGEYVERPTDFALYVADVPLGPLRTDPELKSVIDSEQYIIWMQANRAVGCHFTHEKRTACLQIYSYGEHEKLNEPDHFISPGDPRIPSEGFAPRVQRILQRVSRWWRIQDYERRDESEDDWIDQTGRIVLLGEAAWQSLPGSFYGAGMTVEDAVVLGTLLSRLQSMDQLSSMLYAYEDIRKNRRKAVRDTEIDNSISVTIADEAAIQARNEGFLLTEPEQWNESNLHNQLEKWLKVIAYDAMDAAEEWWVNWGRYSKSAQPAPFGDVAMTTSRDQIA